jgi:hypothetical protein
MKLGVEYWPQSKRDDDDHVILPAAIECANRPIELDSVHQLLGRSGVRATLGQCGIANRSVKGVVLCDESICWQRVRLRSKVPIELTRVC